MNILKQSTAATVKLGAFVDDTDGKTAETGLTISQADIRLSKNGGDFAQTNNATGATHDEFGYYDIPLDTTDTNTLGRLRVAVSVSGALPVWQDFLVVTANVYDTLCSTDNLDVNVTALAADVITAPSLKADAVTEIQNGLALEATLTAIKGAGWTAETLANLFITLSLLETIDGKLDTLDNYIDTEIAAILEDTGTTLPASIAAVKAETALIVADTGTDGVVLKAAGLAADAVAEIADAVWDEAIADHATATTFGGKNQKVVPSETVGDYKADVSSLATTAHVQEVEDKVDIVDGIADAIVEDTGTTIPATLATLATSAALATVDTNVDSILADTNELQTDLVNGGRLDLLIDSIITHLTGIKGGTWTTGDTIANISFAISLLDAPLATIKGYLDTEIAAILADTNEIQAELADGGRTDLLIDAIKAKTDQLTFTVANKVDATATTDTSNIAGDVWSYAKRTLTHPSVSAEEPEDSNTLILYRDADIAIELTDLTIPAGAKKYIFTIKDNLDSGDDQAVLQASYAIDGSEVETNTLVYINSAEAPALTNPVTFTLTETNITIDLTAEAAALLPRYERGYLNWDLKLVTDAAVTIVLQGLAQIIGTSTRAIE